MNKKNKLLNFQILSAIFVMILGTLLHFTFEWSNKNLIIGAFSAVNESIWEHLKLVFFPMLLTTIIGYFYFKKEIPNFLCSQTIGIIIAILFIVVFFYTYTGIIGTNFAFLDISSFFVSIILSEYISYKIMQSSFSFNTTICLGILIILLFCFIFFTYSPPNLQLFKDPIFETFGIIN